MIQNERTASGVLSGVLGLVGLGLVAAILVTAALAPGIAVASNFAKASVTMFDDLPSSIVLGELSQANTIYAIRGGADVPIATIYNQNRQDVVWNAVSPYLKDAAVDGEDRRFYQHGGVDVPSVVRAAIGNLADHGITSGSSTLDMQLVKNILVQEALQISDASARKKAYTAAITDTLSRKLRETRLAISLDKKYSKQQILLGYLNITGFGGNTYGVEAASQQYFSEDASAVTIAQAASLIAIVQQPTYQNLASPKNYPANKVRRDQILNDMLQEKDITPAQLATALATPIATEVKISSSNSGCLYAADAKFACDYVQRLVPTLAALGDSAADRTRRWQRGGYKVYTSIDLAQQDAADAVVQADAPANETRFALGASAVSIQPGTGRILVMSENKTFDDSGPGGGPTTTAVNYNTDQEYGGSSGFQTGSTYKIFTLADWLQHGHGLYQVVNGSVRSFPQSSFAAPCSAPFVGTYSPRNDSADEGGPMTVIKATENSVNAAFVTMAQQLDLCDIRDVATAMGVHRADGSPLNVSPSSVLGTNEIAPLTMAGAIATIGADGTYCAPRIVDKVVDAAGHSLEGQAQQCSQALAPDIASTVAFALASVMNGGTGTAGNPRDGVPVVGKTGTTEDADQNWLIGTTTKVALAVWVGNTQGHQNLRKITVAGTNGYNTKFNIFRTTMKSLDTNPLYRGVAFQTPDPTLLTGTQVFVPDVLGASMATAESDLSRLGFSAIDGGQQPSSFPAGEVSGSNPSGGTAAPIGSTVTLYSSSGPPTVTMPDEVGSQLASAVSDLGDNGIPASQVTYSWVASSAAQKCTVLQTAPAAGSTISASTQVILDVADGRSTSGIDPGIGCP